MIGAGGFARSTLIPALREEGARLVAVATQPRSQRRRRRIALRVRARRGSFDEILADDSVGAVVIATRHASHASLAAAALRAGKAVFVEKPLALTWEQLDEVESAVAADSVLMVGFNRRFAPLVERLQAELGQIDDLVLSMRVNAGPLPDDHWLHDPEDGGGRLLGEGCHFVDLLSHLAGSPAVSGHAVAVPQPGRPIECSDSFTAHIRFGNAVGTLVYSGGGDPRLPKERLEAFGGGVGGGARRLPSPHRPPRRETTRVEVVARQGTPRRDQAVPRGRGGRGGAAAGAVVPRLHAPHSGPRRLAQDGQAR